MAKKKNQKIRKLHKPLNINVGVIIFGIIFVYLAFSVTAYLSKEKIQFYEVVQGGDRKRPLLYGIDPSPGAGEEFCRRGLYQSLSAGGKEGVCGSQNLFPG